MKKAAGGSGLGDALRAARSGGNGSEAVDMVENQNTRIPESQNTSDETVNLSVKVPRSLRLHWLIEAKKQGTSLTEAITDALTERFGKPGA